MRRYVWPPHRTDPIDWDLATSFCFDCCTRSEAIITYAFAILFKQLTEGSSVGMTLFQSVPESLNTLLLPAVFGANANIINQTLAGLAQTFDKQLLGDSPDWKPKRSEA